MGDEITPEVEKVLSMYVPVELKVEVPIMDKQKEPEDYSMDEIKELCKRRGAYEVMSREQRISFHGEYKETDNEIACSLGLKVWEFHLMISRYAKNYHSYYGLS